MKSLFDPEGNRKIVERIKALDPVHPPLWGKMSAAQMVTHAQRPLQVAIGELKLKQGLIGMLFGKMIKRQLSTIDQFKPNLPTAPQFVIRDQPDFIKERNTLIRLVEDFAKKKSAVPSNKHPIFGMMDEQEWDSLQWKHLDHHLRQFGV